ncbi:MAG TPA: hypothetical protein VFK07_03460 [Candidatus Paceibacterota bacterium]|nr:hypothetical protein [Candidatus Paceibacterota bacterium]
MLIRSEAEVLADVLRRLESPNRRERRGSFQVEIASGEFEEALKDLTDRKASYRYLARQIDRFGGEVKDAFAKDGPRLVLYAEVNLDRMSARKIRERLKQLGS